MRRQGEPKWDMDDLANMAQPTCGYCRDCRWWKGYLPAMQWGDCVKARDVGAKAIPYTPDRYEDTDLQTEFDFGCVQFEALASADNVDDHNDTR